ncbi:MAG: tetratricopeptide repeat protein [Pirellulales bacterium]
MRRIALHAVIYLGYCTAASLAREPQPPKPPGEPAAAEYGEFVDELTKTMNARDPAFFQEGLNEEEMVERALKGLPPEREISEGLLLGISQQGNLPDAIVRALGDKGSYLPLWVRTVNGKTRVLMRMVTSEGTLNYHEFLLLKNALGRIEAVDVYVFVTGELMSQTLRRGALTLIAEKKKSLVTRLLEGDQNFLKHVDTITAIHQANQGGQYQRVLDLYAKLPAKMQADKALMIARIQAALHVGDEAYLAALDDFAKQFPNDPAGDLMLLDATFLHKDYDKCLATVDSLDKRLGGDPYLNTFRASVALVQGKTDEAKKFFEAVIAGAPGVVQPYFALVEISLAQMDFAETARLMTVLENELGMRFPDDLSQVEIFQPFVESPEYGAWQAKRRQP